MKEIYCVILQGFLATREKVNVQADHISVDDDGVRLFDEERCVAFFSRGMLIGVYRQVDASLEIKPEEAEEAEKGEQIFGQCFNPD